MEDKLTDKFKTIVKRIEGFAESDKGISDVEQGILSELMGLGKDMLEHYKEKKEVSLTTPNLSDGQKKR
jgi:hypothetical protein